MTVPKRTVMSPVPGCQDWLGWLGTIEFSAQEIPPSVET